jgi:hypothetical protein
MKNSVLYPATQEVNDECSQSACRGPSQRTGQHDGLLQRKGIDACGNQRRGEN